MLEHEEIETELKKNKEKHSTIRKKERAKRRQKSIRCLSENFSIEVILLINSIDNCFRYLENDASTFKQKIESCQKLAQSIPALKKWIIENNKTASQNVIFVLEETLEQYNKKVTQLNNGFDMTLECTPHIAQQRPLLYMSPDYSTQQVDTNPEHTNTMHKHSKKENKCYKRYFSS